MSNITRRHGLKLGLSALAAAPLVAASAKQALAATHQVEIAGFAFNPEALSVAVGDTVVFTNRDGAPHTATALDSQFDTGTIRRNKQAQVVIEAAGELAYKCNFHPAMRGVIVAS